MKIQSRLTLISSAVFGVVFIVTSALVYVIFMTSSRRMVVDDLEKISSLTAQFYLDQDEMSLREHERIGEEFQKQSEQNIVVRIYNERDMIRYGDRTADTLITTALLTRVRKEGQVSLQAGDRYYLGMFYPDNQGDFVVFVYVHNPEVAALANRLLFILFVALMLGLAAIVLLSLLVSRLAYRPVSDVIREVNALDPNSLGKPLTLPGTNDELHRLIDTFNMLLKRLADTFQVQKKFINYVSHEFKTPLASMVGNLEVFAQRERTPAEYRQVTKQVVEQVYHIEGILQTLLVISGLKQDSVSKAEVRLDDVVWDIVSKLAQHHSNTVSVQLDIPATDESLLHVRVDTVQIHVALYNILDNAAKFSQGQAITLTLGLEAGRLKLTIIDTGIGIPANEQGIILQPFRRGSNVQNVGGSGIGLSLASMILKQNGIDFSLQSTEGMGTQVTLLFPSL